MNIKAKNKIHYDNIYTNVNVDRIVENILDFDNFFEDLITYHTSWVGFYKNNFKNYVKNKKVLELGCGDCTNSAILTKLGAEVYANDISSVSGKIIETLNKRLNFHKNITFIKGDFLNTDIELNKFDLVIGKAFVHHLTHHEEELFLKKIIKVLKPEGMVRYLEPCVNSKVLDEIRWLIPVPGRPSKLQTNKFKIWKKNDPHPDRDNSSNSYRAFGRKYFKECHISYVGSLVRFERLIPSGKFRSFFKKYAFILEKYIPNLIDSKVARSQIIDYKFPV